MNIPELEDLKSLGPATQSRYDDSSRDDQSRRDRSQHQADSSVCPKDAHHGKSRSGTTDKGSSRSESGSRRHNQKSSKHKEESLGAKMLAPKECKKRYKKIVDNPMLYLEKHQHQILLEEHEPEIASLHFFGTGAERAAIEVLALIDWVAEYVEIS